MPVNKEELTAEKLLKRELSHEILAKLPEPKNVWKYFLLLTENPRKSHNLGKITQVLLELAPKLGVQADVDAAGNIRFRKEAKPGFENAPSICIQSHIDMVTSANADTQIDFDNDPITPRIDGEWLKATGTTLGADDGLGVAGSLAILEDDSMNHGLIEALFTVDEETTMGGGENLGPHPFLISDILLNVDSEEENGICIGCAGGHEETLRLKLTREASIEEDHQYFSIFVSGLLGGHSGVDIALGRANANKFTNKMIRSSVYDIEDVKLVEFNGGNQPNVITREATVVLSVPRSSVDQFKLKIQSSFERLQQSYLSVEHLPSDDSNSIPKSNINLAITEVASSIPSFDRCSTFKVIDTVEIFPHGVVRMSYDVSGLVETSNNLSNIKTVNDVIEIHTFARSSSISGLSDFHETIQSIGRVVGAEVVGPSNAFPGWDPDVHALALRVMKKAFTDVRQIEPHVYAIHAGLECGLIKGIYPKISCVSVGPEIKNAHSPDEAALIPSVDRYYQVVKRFIEDISRESKENL